MKLLYGKFYQFCINRSATCNQVLKRLFFVVVPSLKGAFGKHFKIWIRREKQKMQAFI
jgi:hypothetical protein